MKKVLIHLVGKRRPRAGRLYEDGTIQLWNGRLVALEMVRCLAIF